MASPLLLLLLVPLALAVLLLLALYHIIYPRPVKIPIKGRHVFISGGSTGIGLAMAKLAAGQGARVSILARDRRKLEAARDEICRATGADVAVYSADVRDAAAVREAVQAAGTVDVLVCNQGVANTKPLVELDTEEVQELVGINLMGSINLVKAAIPAMKRAAAEDGLPRSIAFTTSDGGLAGVYGYAAYCACHFAIRGFAEAMQMELISDNIHMSLIHAPETDTLSRHADFETRPELSNIIVRSSGNTMKPVDVATIALDGIKVGKFAIHLSFLGSVMSVATAGFSPQRSFLMAFAEVMGAGFMRLLALSYLSGWYKMIENYNAKKKSGC